RFTTTRSSGFIVSYGTPLGLITTNPCSREIPLAFPNVYSTSPRRTSSRLASSTSSRRFFRFMHFLGPQRQCGVSLGECARRQLGRYRFSRIQNTIPPQWPCVYFSFRFGCAVTPCGRTSPSRSTEWRPRAPSAQHWKNSRRRGVRNRARRYSATAFVIPVSPPHPHRRRFPGDRP